MDIKLILKGFIVGIGKIIPGVSGSMLAITLGIYEKLIEAVTDFFGNVREHIKLLFNFGMGVFIAIIVFSKLILFLLNNFYFETMYLFLGLILGTLIPFMKQLKVNKWNVFLFIICLMIMIIISCGQNTSLLSDCNNSLVLVFLGMIDAATSIIPGISGTLIFMMLGSYELVLSTLANLFNLQFFIYGLGVVLGVIVVCYVMNYLFKKKRDATYSVIFAFMISSVGILFSNLSVEFNMILFMLLLVGLGIGYFFR